MKHRSMFLLAAALLGANQTAQAGQTPRLRITSIGLDSHYTQGDRCFLMPVQGGGDYESYGEIDVQNGRFRFGLNGSEKSAPLDVRTGHFGRSGAANGVRFAMTPFGLRSPPYPQFTTLTLSGRSGSTSRRFRVECNQ